MSGQFKKPFQDPEEQKPSFIAEQDTLKPPSVSPSAARNFQPNNMPSQGYVQGKHGQYGSRQTGQFSPGMGAFNQPGGAPMNPPFVPPQTPRQPGLPMQARGPFGIPGMGKTYTPNLAWSGQSALASAEKQNDLIQPGQGKRKRGKKKRRVPIWARIVLGFLTFLLLLGGGGFWYYQVNIAPALNAITGKSVSRAQGEPDPNHGKTGSVLNWGRINILLLGSDTDEKPVWGSGQYLAQTDIVVSIDTNTHDVEMLSIPRDFWIKIPDTGMGKLDQAFSAGGSLSNNMGGVRKSRLTIEQDFGIPINFYAWVGLDGFVKVIDTVGGVDVDVLHPIVDDNYPDDVGTHGQAQNGYKRLYIPDGPQHLDGPTALNYVRSRHADLVGDFGRSARQQQILDALKLKLNNLAILNELPQLANDLKGSVYTDMTTDKVFDLMRFARGINSNQIKHLTLGGSPYSHNGTIDVPGIGTESVVWPNCDAIIPAINTFLHINTAKCDITASSGARNAPLASVPPQSAPLANSVQPATPDAGLLASNQLVDGSFSGSLDAFNNFLGVRDVLDLMSMVLLNSPQI